MTEQLGQPTIFVPIIINGASAGGETLFATRIRDGVEPQRGVYAVDCVPLFVDLYHGDVVLCDETDPERLPQMIEVLERNNTVLIHVLLTPKGSRAADEVLDVVRETGAHVEKVEGQLYAVNVHFDELGPTVEALSEYPYHLRWWLDGQTPDGTVTPPA